MGPSPEELTYLGLDLSLRSPGFALVDGAGVLLHVEHPQVHERGTERLAVLRDHVRRVVAMRPVSFALIEGYSYDSQHRALDIGEGGGMAKLTLQDLGVPFQAAAPSIVKKFATGNAGASKSDMIGAAYALSGVALTSDDEADAVALAYLARALRTEGYRGSRAQTEAVHSLRTAGTPKLKVRARVPKRSLRERL